MTPLAVLPWDSHTHLPRVERGRYLDAPMSGDSPIGARGRVTSTGAIRTGRTGEVMVAVGGGVQAYLARDVDGGEIGAYEEVVVIDHLAARTVLVSRIPTSSQEDP